MPITVTCPNCNVRYKNIPDEYTGKRIRCKRCAEPFYLNPIQTEASLPGESEFPLRRDTPFEADEKSLALSLAGGQSGYDPVQMSSLFDDIPDNANAILNMIKDLRLGLDLSVRLLQSMTLPMLVCDEDRKIVLLNTHMIHLLENKGDPAVHLGTDVFEFFCQNDFMRNFISKAFAENVAVDNVQVRLNGRLGGEFLVSLYLSPLHDANGRVEYVSLAVLNLTEIRDREREILTKKMEIKNMTGGPREQGAPVLVISSDPQGNITSLTPILKSTLERVGVELQEFLPPNHADIVNHCLSADQSKDGVEHKVGDSDFVWTYNPLSTHGLVQIHVTDVTQRKRMVNQPLDDDFHDTLTGLPNRNLFLDRLNQAMTRSKRNPGAVFAILYMNLDRFTLVNDSLGHSAGDALLMELSKRILSSLRSGDSLARLGGDEFIVLLDPIKDISDGLLAAERIQKQIGRPYRLEKYELYPSASIGIVVDNGQYSTPENLVRDAATAMSRAKTAGKGGCEVFDPEMHTHARKRLAMEMELKRDLDKDGFRVFYQPIVCMKTGRLDGFEALVRWFHPERGIVNPGEFIPLAEETGLIVPLGAYVLSEACRQATAWRNRYKHCDKLIMSVNLSVRQFLSTSLLDDIRQILDWTEYPPELLKLEVTESGVMENAGDSVRLLTELHDMHIRLSIDDFGTGYSSLSYLHKFPFDYLKVDQSFVHRMERERENMEIVRTIISMAHCMKKEVIAEGIEEESQYKALKELGCEFGQGFLFSKPVPKKEAEQLLKANTAW